MSERGSTPITVAGSVMWVILPPTDPGSPLRAIVTKGCAMSSTTWKFVTTWFASQTKQLPLICGASSEPNLPGGTAVMPMTLGDAVRNTWTEIRSSSVSAMAGGALAEREPMRPPPSKARREATREAALGPHTKACGPAAPMSARATAPVPATTAAAAHPRRLSLPRHWLPAPKRGADLIAAGAIWGTWGAGSGDKPRSRRQS
mmetsp:Transcript_36838/g.97555  ORF Transcript_36838/g.97555 Transcript_36838/m.97555 type:complete len:203 (+) Transcript_36838:450-1058(+)